MQYWNGSAYALNTADHCSSLNATDLQMNDAANWSGINVRTSNSSSASATTNASLFPAVVAQGAGAILFTAPNNTGWVDISASSSLPLWMQDLSLSSGLAPARASFGYYRGNDRLIYRREVFGGQ
jgi:MSHA biogenesis protein MshQ